ncbi:MAG: DNA-directed RNA polymerase subunit alpha [Patescibacteria group bacterium]
MEQIPLPTKIEYREDKENKNKGEVIIEPCFPGYGTTWGNALRRVLLSSLTGGAVTAVKIKGVKHEFSTIPYVKEDVLEIILNLKQLRMKIFTDEEIRLSLKAQGEKKVYAKDIEKDARVEIVNPDLLIATLTDKKAKLEMEIFVKKGRGYVPVEERKTEEREIGKILIDSIFTPIRSVGLKVENVRVGEKTNFDRLTLPIETDGTITPLEAFIQAADFLKDHFSFISEKAKSLIVPQKEEKKKETKKKKGRARKK